MSARKQTGVSQQNPSGTAALAPQQKSGCTAAIDTGQPRHAKTASQGWGRPCTAYQCLDIAPKGRDEDGLPYPMAWVRHRIDYER